MAASGESQKVQTPFPSWQINGDIVFGRDKDAMVWMGDQASLGIENTDADFLACIQDKKIYKPDIRQERMKA